MTAHQKPRAQPSLLVDPVVLSAVALMVANDWWLKAAFHNNLTGKLSDVAICFFLPAFFAEWGSLLAPRWGSARWLWAGAGGAAALFAVLELSPLAADSACRGLALVGPWLGLPGPFVMTRDLTDLWTLLLVPAAVVYCRIRLRYLGHWEVLDATA